MIGIMGESMHWAGGLAVNENAVFVPGTRVHHYGHQWVGAAWDGTATVIGTTNLRGRHFDYIVDIDERVGEPARRAEWPCSLTIKAHEQLRAQ